MRATLYVLAVVLLVAGAASVPVAIAMPSLTALAMTMLPLGLGACLIALAGRETRRIERRLAQQGRAEPDQLSREGRRFAMAAGTLLPAAALGVYASFEVLWSDMPFLALAAPIVCVPLVAAGLPSLLIAQAARHARLFSGTPSSATDPTRWATVAFAVMAGYAAVLWFGWKLALASSPGPFPRVTVTEVLVMQAAAGWAALLLAASLSPVGKWSAVLSIYPLLLAVSLSISALTSYSTHISSAREALILSAGVTVAVTPALLVVRLLFGRR